MDSVRVAEDARDWAETVRWFRRVAAIQPTNPMVLVGLALAQQNLMWVGRADSPDRASVRTSLERIRTQREVLALIDSATALTHSDAEWAQVRRWSGQSYENLSLPLDALQIYTEIRSRVPGFQPTLQRAEGQLQILRDPHALPATGLARLPATPDELPR
jgi:hypothetical protein